MGQGSSGQSAVPTEAVVGNPDFLFCAVHADNHPHTDAVPKESDSESSAPDRHHKGIENGGWHRDRQEMSSDETAASATSVTGNWA